MDILKTLIARFAGKSANFIVFAILARSLSLPELALYGFVFSISQIHSTILDLGCRNSLAFYVGQVELKSEQYLKAAFYIWMFAALITGPIAYVTIEFSSFRDGGLELVVALFFLIVSMVYLRIMQGALLGEGNIDLFNKTDLVSRVVLVVLTVCFAILHFLTLQSAMWTLVASQMIGAGYLYSIQRKSLVVKCVSRLDVVRSAKSLLRRGFVFMLAVVVMVTAKRLSFLAITELSGADASGVFFAIHRLTEIVTEVALAVAVVLFSKNVRGGGIENALSKSAEASRVSFFLLMIICAILWVGGEHFVRIVLGARYINTETLFSVLLASTLAGVVWTVLFPSLSVILTPTWMLVAFVPGLVANLVSIKPLLSTYGVVGAAFSSLIGNIVCSATVLLLIKGKYKISIYSFLILSGDDIKSLILKLRKRRK